MYPLCNMFATSLISVILLTVIVRAIALRNFLYFNNDTQTLLIEQVLLAKNLISTLASPKLASLAFDFNFQAKVLNNGFKWWYLLKLLFSLIIDSGSIRVDFSAWRLIILVNDKQISSSCRPIPFSGIKRRSTKKMLYETLFYLTKL